MALIWLGHGVAVCMLCDGMSVHLCLQQPPWFCMNFVKACLVGWPIVAAKLVTVCKGHQDQVPVTPGVHHAIGDVRAALSNPAPELNNVGVACVKNFRDMRS